MPPTLTFQGRIFDHSASIENRNLNGRSFFRPALGYSVEDFQQFCSKLFNLLRAQSVNFFQLG
jgi:hypothetical protein